MLALVAAGVARLCALDDVAPLVRAWAAWAGACIVLVGFTQIGAFDSDSPSSATRLAATHSHNKEWKPETKGHLLPRVPEPRSRRRARRRRRRRARARARARPARPLSFAPLAPPLAATARAARARTSPQKEPRVSLGTRLVLLAALGGAGT